MVERIKNPIIGTFVLSWVFYSRVGITNFLLGDNEVKRTIVTGYSLEWGDVFVPALMTFIYVSLNQIILPFVQHHIDKFKLKHVEQKRFDHRADVSLANSESEARANKGKCKATLAYAEKLAEKELLGWVGEKEEFIKEAKNLNKECDDLDLKVRSLTDKLEEQDKYIQNSQHERTTFIGEKHDLEDERDKLQRELTKKSNRLDELSAENKEQSIYIKQIISNSVELSNKATLSNAGLSDVNKLALKGAGATKVVDEFYSKASLSSGKKAMAKGVVAKELLDKIEGREK